MIPAEYNISASTDSENYDITPTVQESYPRVHDLATIQESRPTNERPTTEDNKMKPSASALQLIFLLNLKNSEETNQDQ